MADNDYPIKPEIQNALENAGLHSTVGVGTSYRNQNRAGTSLDERFVVEIYRLHKNRAQQLKMQG